MKVQLQILLLFLLLAPTAFANGYGELRRKTPVSASVFPRYQNSIRTGPRVGRPPVQIPMHHDSLGNRVTEDHMNRVEFAHGRSENVMKRDVRVTDVVRVGRARFTNVYRPEFEHKTVIMSDFAHRYNTVVVEHPVFLDVWHRHGFYGGFYYGFHPIADIDVYFYNPMVYWFYVGTADDYYYRNWYKAEYDAYPELHKPFVYHGLYYPTENLRQLLFGVSAMPVEKQARFRDAISNFTRRMAQKMANGLGVHIVLGTGDIAVTHYEILGTDSAVDLEGVVTFGGKPYNFKGLVDIESPEQSDVFVPATWDKNPTSEQLSTLDSLNSRISALKGDSPEAVSAEPETVMPGPSPGSVTADPEGQ